MSKSNAGGGADKKSKGTGPVRKRENIAKMRDLLSKAKATYANNVGEDSCLFTDVGNSKRLEFSNMSLCVYEKHKNLINDIFLNKNINTFVSYNDKSLHSWNPESMELISHINFNDAESSSPIQSITCLCYSEEKHLYFACSKDLKLFVFNEHLNLVYQKRMPVGLVQIINFYDAGNQPQLLVGGKEGCFIIDLDIQFKYDAQMAILLDPKGQSITIKIKQIVADDNALEAREISGEADGDNTAKTGTGKGSKKRGAEAFAGAHGSQSDAGGDDHYASGALQNQNANLPVNYDEKVYGNYIKQLQGVGEWVKGLKIFESQRLIVAWKKEILSGGGSSDEQQRASKIKQTRDQIIFYSLTTTGLYQQGEIWSKYYDSSIKEDFITDILVFKDQKFFITAHNFGDIHLRKLVELKNIEVDVQASPKKDGQGGKENPVLKSVHVFKGHSRTVTSLAPIKSKGTYFVSSSLDGKVRIWCFEKMIELYCFDITVNSPVINSAMADSIMAVNLINDKIYAMVFKSYIEIGIVNSHLASSYYISTQSIGGLGKCYANNRDREANNPNSLFISFNDNSIVILDPIEQSVKCTIYPPPTPAEVARVFYCTSIQRIFLLLASRQASAADRMDPAGESSQPDDLSKSGAICVYRIDKETGTLESIKESKSLKDYEGKSMNQAITCISNCSTEPPQYDCEIPPDLYKYAEPAEPDYEFVQDEDGIILDQFLVIGLSKGTVIFVKVNNLSHIFARFSIHREAVMQINEIREIGTFLSICKENILKIWGFNEGENKLPREVIKGKFNLYREVFKIVVSKQNQLLICFQSGDSEMLVWDEPNKQLCKLPVDKSDEHEDTITCCDTLLSNGMLVTGDYDGLVKIWNSKKQLIREIKFVEPINSVAFLNPQGDIIVGHSGNLSKLEYKTYKDEAEPAQLEDEKDEKLAVQRYSGPNVEPREFEGFMSTKEPVPLDGFLQMIQRSEQALPMPAGGATKCCPPLAHKSTPAVQKEEKQEKKQPQGVPNNNKAPAAKSPPKKPTIAVLQTPQVAVSKQPSAAPTINPQAHLPGQQNAPGSQAHAAPGQPAIPGGSPGGNHINIQNQHEPNQSVSNNTSKIIDPEQQQRDLEVQLDQLRQNCVKISCVPKSYTMVRKKMQQRDKQIQMIKNSTRRTMTSQRISSNIVKTNDPRQANEFHDIFVSQATSHGNLQITFNNTSNMAKSFGGGAKYHKGAKSTVLNNSAGVRKGSRFQGQRSQLSDEAFNQKISHMQAQLKQMANSANTFSIFDNNSFEPARIQNHKLNSVYKNALQGQQNQNYMPFVAMGESQNSGNLAQTQALPPLAKGTRASREGPAQKSSSMQQNSGQNYVIVSMQDQLKGQYPHAQIDSAMPSKDYIGASKQGLPQVVDHESGLGQNQQMRQNNNQFTPNQQFTNTALNKQHHSNFSRQKTDVNHALDTSESPPRNTNYHEDKRNSSGHGDLGPQTAQLQYDGSSRDNSPMMTMKDQKSRLQNRKLMDSDIKFPEDALGSTLKKNPTDNANQQLQIKVLQKPLDGNATDQNNSQSNLGPNDQGLQSSETKHQVQSMPTINEGMNIKNNNGDDTQVNTTSGDITKDGKRVSNKVSNGTSELPQNNNGVLRQQDDQIVLSDGEHTKTVDGEVGQDVEPSSRLVMKKIDERQVVVNLTMEPTVGGTDPEQAETAPEPSPDKGNRFYVVQKVKPDMNENEGLNTGNQQSVVSSMKGMTSIGNVQTRFNPKPVSHDRAHAGVGAQMENEFIQRSVGDGANLNQYDILSDYEEQIKRYEAKEYSQKIRGSNRQQAPGQFVQTRLQKRASQLQSIQPHLVTNAILKSDFNYKTQARAGGVITFKPQAPPILPPQSSTGTGPVSSLNYQPMKNQNVQSDAEQTHNLMMNSMGTGGSLLSKNATGGLVELRVSTNFNNTGKSPFPRGKNSSPHGSQYDSNEAHQIPSRGNTKSGKSGRSPHFASKRTTTGAFSMHLGGGQRSISGSPGHEVNHETLANALVNSNERIQYGLSSNQTTQRKGGLFTSLPQNPGNVIYMKNIVPQGLHMPSKGLYNYQKRSNEGFRKPQTAGNSNGRRQKFNSLAQQRQQQDSMPLMDTSKATPKTRQGNRYLSNYRQNMNNIQALSEVAQMAAGGQQINLQQL